MNPHITFKIIYDPSLTLFPAVNPTWWCLLYLKPPLPSIHDICVGKFEISYDLSLEISYQVQIDAMLGCLHNTVVFSLHVHTITTCKIIHGRQRIGGFGLFLW